MAIASRPTWTLSPTARGRLEAGAVDLDDADVVELVGAEDLARSLAPS